MPVELNDQTKNANDNDKAATDPATAETGMQSRTSASGSEKAPPAFRAHIVTWALSVLSACIIAAAWIKTHPAPRMVRVDMGSLFDDQKKALSARIKPGMSEQEQKALLQSATDYAAGIEASIDAVARECGCAVLNSAAILRLPDSAAAGIPDMTARVRELVAGKS
jgi:hypothetical protein